MVDACCALARYKKSGLAWPRFRGSRLRFGLLLVVVCSVCLPHCFAEDSSLPVKLATEMQIRGWTVHVQQPLLEERPEQTRRALALLERQLDEILERVPAAAVKKLRQVPLWFSSPYPDQPPRAEYHPNAGWLREHGRDPEMARAVEFSNVHVFEKEMRRMPNFVLHELSHAYHHRELEDGFGNARIKAAYERAKAGGKYERVLRADAEGRLRNDRAYALTNPQEYFAETSEAYFSRNDFFPFTSGELQTHDPAMFALLTELWGVEKNTP